MNSCSKNKQRYRELCLSEKSIPIFSQDWWLDAVAGEDYWDVIFSEENGEIIASLPFYIKKKMGFKINTMPALTQKLGIWTKYPNKTGEHEKKVIEDLIIQIPPFDMFIQHFDYTFANWLPFYWRNFKQTTMYTYILENIKDHENIYKNFNSNVKRNIKKANKKVKIKTDLDMGNFYKTYKKTFERQNLPAPHSFEFLSRLDSFCSKKHARKVFYAEDENGRVHAAIYIIWDNESAYYLMGGADPTLRSSGAMSLLLWEAIQFSSNFVDKFDFEGSMIEPIERFFRSFGSIQKPYFRIMKTPSTILRIRNAIVELKN